MNEGNVDYAECFKTILLGTIFVGSSLALGLCLLFAVLRKALGEPEPIFEDRKWHL